MKQAESYLATGIILIKDDKILLMRRAATGYADGYYAFVGGKCDAGESITQNAIRETQEEAGVTIAPEDLKFMHVIHRIDEGHDKNWVLFFFTADKWQGTITNMEPIKHDILDWFPLDNLPGPIVPTHAQVLDEWRNKGLCSIFRQAQEKQG